MATRSLSWCSHLDFLPLISMLPNRGWNNKIAWFQFAKWLLAFIIVIQYDEEHDQDGGSIIKVCNKPWFILPVSAKQIMTSHGCFRSVCFAGVEHSCTFATSKFFSHLHSHGRGKPGLIRGHCGRDLGYWARLTHTLRIRSERSTKYITDSNPPLLQCCRSGRTTCANQLCIWSTFMSVISACLGPCLNSFEVFRLARARTHNLSTTLYYFVTCHFLMLIHKAILTQIFMF